MDPVIAESRLAVSRRRALGLGGTIGLGTLLAACAPGASEPTTSGSATPTPLPTASDGAAIQPSTTPTSDIITKLEATSICGLETVEVTQGPYYFDVDSIRSDIREDRPGTRLDLALRVLDRDCLPVPSSVVEIWHCDAGGVYSGFEVSQGGPGGGSRGAGGTSDGSYSSGVSVAAPIDDGTYLRGAQVADEHGIVQFVTIYPGWYRGRTPHIHLKVHVERSNVLTAQLYFDDTLTDAVYQSSPYDARPGRDTRNSDDSIYDASGLLVVEQADEGYLAYLNLGL